MTYGLSIALKRDRSHEPGMHRRSAVDWLIVGGSVRIRAAVSVALACSQWFANMELARAAEIRLQPLNVKWRTRAVGVIAPRFRDVKRFRIRAGATGDIGAGRRLGKAPIPYAVCRLTLLFRVVTGHPVQFMIKRGALVQKLISVAAIMLAVLFAALPVFGQSSPPSEAARKAELVAAWQAASQAGTAGPADVTLIDQARLKLPEGRFFVPKTEGTRVLRALGNLVNDETFIGLVVGTRQNDQWIVVIRYVKEGYIKDDDAKNWNADELLSGIKEGVEESNKDRVARGFPELEVVGWIQPPAYDAGAHRLVWSMLGKDKGQPDNQPKGVNFNTYALGRDGYFSLNLLSNSDRIESEKPVARELLGDLSYNEGKRYEDFSAGTDRVAAYGLAALIGGVAAKKLGLLAIVTAFVLKFAKVILLAVAAFGAGIMKFFRRKPRTDVGGDVT
ncbi:DUF2167 domain-containing protein [uncultured Bradyrhizobium sp.]|uniref:DUF2167 domain-containing protein n=1 Tax=uncultured Bradyrhizobium sp. TaxID=199684 RepID=UPI00261EC1F6|nr:DUF2167 domain-containing protein [uncultured Bradyrhizobium sp.]